MSFVSIPVRDSTAGDKILRSKGYARQMSLFPIHSNQTAEVSKVAETKSWALTDRGYDRDPSGQKDILHSLRHLPVKVIDVPRSTRILPVIVVPACRWCDRKIQVHSTKMHVLEHSVSVSIARSFDVSDTGNERAWRCHRTLMPPTKPGDIKRCAGTREKRKDEADIGVNRWRSEVEKGVTYR